MKKMAYNPKTHHRRSIRLQSYDYSQAGLYFITICCHHRICLFGEISDGGGVMVGAENILPLRENKNQIMILNNAGKIADACWREIPKHFQNAILHEYIIMPNHVHGIIELTNETHVGAENILPLRENILPLSENMDIGGGAEYILPLPPRNKFQKMIPHSIGSMVKGFKIGVTKWFRNNAAIPIQHPPLPIWQRNYYEHIIRNDQSYQSISDYIINNPAKWREDKFFTK